MQTPSKAVRPVDSRVTKYVFPTVNAFVCPTESSVDLPITITLVAADEEFVADGTGTPLSHTIFLPDLIAVYFLPRKIIVWPIFVGFKVGVEAANAEVLFKENALSSVAINTDLLLWLFIIEE